VGKVLEKSRLNLEERRDQLKQIIAEFKQTRESYLRDTLEPSVISSLSRMPALTNEVQDKLVPILARDTSTGSGNEPDRSAESALDLAAQPIRDRIAQIEQPSLTPQQTWQLLEPVSRVAPQRLGELPIPDREAISDLRSKYFDQDGVIRSQWVADKVHGLATVSSQGLRTPPDSAQGLAVRYQLNRGFPWERSLRFKYSATPGARPA
jgi:hypothetical protein